MKRMGVATPILQERGSCPSRMNTLPENVINNMYRLSHEMQYSSVMKQFKQDRLNIVFNVSIDCLEYGYYYHHGDRTPCVSIDNIEAAPHELLGLIRIDNAVTKYLFDFWGLRHETYSHHCYCCHDRCCC